MDFGVGPPPGPVPLGALLPSAVVVGLNGGFLAAALFVLARWSERFPTLSRRGPIWLLGPSVLFVGDLTWLVTTFLTRSGRIPDSQYHVCASVAFGVTATGAALCTTAPLWVPQAVATAPRDESDAVLGSRASRPVSVRSAHVDFEDGDFDFRPFGSSRSPRRAFYRGAWTAILVLGVAAAVVLCVLDNVSMIPQHEHLLGGRMPHAFWLWPSSLLWLVTLGIWVMGGDVVVRLRHVLHRDVRRHPLAAGPVPRDSFGHPHAVQGQQWVAGLYLRRLQHVVRRRKAAAACVMMVSMSVLLIATAITIVAQFVPFIGETALFRPLRGTDLGALTFEAIMVTALLIWNAGCAMMYLSTLKAAQTSEQHILAKSSSEDVLVAAMLAQNLSTATAGSTAPRATLAIGPGMVADAGMYSTLVATPPSKHPPSVASHLRYDTTSLSGHSSQHSVVEISDNDNDNDSDDDDDDEGDRTSAEANGDRGPDPAHGIVTVGAPVAATTATDGSWARWFRPAQPVTYGVTNPSNPSTPSIPDFHRFSGAAVGDAGRAARPPGSLAGAPSHRMSFLTDITHAPSTALEPPPSIVAFPIGPRGTAPFQPVDAGLVPARGRSLHRDVVDPGSHGAEAAAAAAHARSLSRERVTVWQADVPLTQPPDRFF